MMKRLLILIGTIVLTSLLAACGNGDASEKAKGKNEVTIGYFPNMTHITTDRKSVV